MSTGGFETTKMYTIKKTRKSNSLYNIKDETETRKGSTMKLERGRLQTFRDTEDSRSEKNESSSEDNEEPQTMPIKGSVLLSPISSYALYGKFPLAFWIHIFIVVFDSYWLM